MPLTNNDSKPGNKVPAPQKGDNRVPGRGRAAAEEPDYAASPLSMTALRSGCMHSVAMKIVLGLLIFIFAIGGYLASGGPQGAPTGPDGRTRGAGPDPVASVAGQSIARDRLERTVERQLQFAQYTGQTPGPDNLLDTYKRSLDSLVEDAAQYKAAEDAGITVSDADVDKEINRLLDEEIKQQKEQNGANFRRRIESEFGSEEKFRDEQRQRYDRELVRRQLMIDKLKKQVGDANKTTEDDYKRSVTKLDLRQIVVRPDFPVPTDKDFKATQEKNAIAAKAEAQKVFAELEAKLKAKGNKGAAIAADFAAVAKKSSDDALTKTKGGELGWKLPSEIQAAAAVKAALLKAEGDLVGPVFDDSSQDSYIYLIEGRKLELPKDYAKKKSEYLKNYDTQRDAEVWGDKQEEYKKAVQPEINDPALAAYKIQTEQLGAAKPEEQGALRQQAVEQYQQALDYASPDQAAAINFQLAQLYYDLKQPEKRIAALQAALKENPNAFSVQLALARSLREQKKNKEAIAELKKASEELSKNPPPASPFGGNPEVQLRTDIAQEFQLLGEKTLAEAERKKIPAPPPGGMPGGMPGGLGGLNLTPGGSRSFTRTIRTPKKGGAGKAPAGKAPAGKAPAGKAAGGNAPRPATP